MAVHDLRRAHPRERCGVPHEEDRRRVHRVDEVRHPEANATDAPLAPADFGISGVSFAIDADRRVIDDVSLRIPQGTSCAINSGRKTTLVNPWPDSGT
ncbi:MAG: hypothetical protein ACLT98_11755 [Eggerthellaceae bacterium]